MCPISQRTSNYPVYDAMIDDERRQNTFGLLMSLNMLIETPAGFDYTGADCIGWMREAKRNDTWTPLSSAIVDTKKFTGTITRATELAEYAGWVKRFNARPGAPK